MMVVCPRRRIIIMKKKFITGCALLLACLMTVQVQPVHAAGKSGSCGENVTWAVSGQAGSLTLTLSGSGEPDFYRPSEVPWSTYSGQITSVVVKDGITSIPWVLFEGMDALTKAEIAGSVGSIGKRAFACCENLKEVILHEGIRELDDSCFYYCGFSSITIPSSVEKFGFGTFSYTPWLSAKMNAGSYVIVNNCLIAVSRSLSGTAVVPGSVKTISSGALSPYMCEYTQTGGHTGWSLGEHGTVTTVILPAGLKKIDEYAFWGTRELERVEIPAGIEEIGWNAFCGSTCSKVYYGGTEEEWEPFRSTVDFDLKENENYTVVFDSSLAETPVTMYRLYNPNSGEHFYTAKTKERDFLKKSGWTYEGIGWYAPTASSVPVYRLYNSYSGDHHYTMKAKERDALIRLGWTDEETGWYSDAKKSVPLYREYNSNMSKCNHNYTTNKAEHTALTEKLGWTDEGIGWYGLKK